MINFTKMHGLGNDFVVMNNIDGDISLSVDEIRKLSDRRFGIGFDQLLMVESAISKEADLWFTALTSAPDAMSELTQSACPRAAALCSGVDPCSFRALASAS